MLSKDELIALAKTTGFKLHQQEKDYIQALALSFIYQAAEAQLVFKGGTALAKVYGLNRFSEDLDFTLNEELDLDAVIEKVSRGLRDYGIENLVKKERPRFDFSDAWKIKANGPLFTGQERTSCFIRVEVSRREKTMLPSHVANLFPLYGDIPNFQVIAMGIDEILAEKVRAILTRDKPRDLYDLWFILNKGARIDVRLINKKLEYYKLTYSKKEFFAKVKAKKSEWESELSLLLRKVPDFGSIASFVRSKFEHIGRSAPHTMRQLV